LKLHTQANAYFLANTRFHKKKRYKIPSHAGKKSGKVLIMIMEMNCRPAGSRGGKRRCNCQQLAAVASGNFLGTLRGRKAIKCQRMRIWGNALDVAPNNYERQSGSIISACHSQLVDTVAA